MSELTELVKAMGFWGWIAVIACTAIVTEAVVRVYAMKHSRKDERGSKENKDFE